MLSSSPRLLLPKTRRAGDWVGLEPGVGEGWGGKAGTPLKRFGDKGRLPIWDVGDERPEDPGRGVRSKA